MQNRVRTVPPYAAEAGAGAEGEAAKADRLWAAHLARENSPISDLFAFQMQSTVQCQG